MNVLLDTHAFLWFIAGDPRLSLPIVSHDPAFDAYSVRRVW